LFGELHRLAVFECDDQFAVGDAMRVFTRNKFHATRQQTLHPANVRLRQKVGQTRFDLVAPLGYGGDFLFFIGGIIPSNGRGWRGKIVGQSGNLHQCRRETGEREDFIFIRLNDGFVGGFATLPASARRDSMSFG